MSNEFKVGEIVWTKLRGHPWWPSRIEDEETIPKNVLSQKPRNGNSIPVMFFGSRDYAWVSNEAIKSYEEHKKDFIKKKNTALFDKAVQQANDPSILEKEIALEKAEYEEEEIEEEEDEEEEEEEEEKPKKNNKRGKRSTKAEPARKKRKEEASSKSSKNQKNTHKEIKEEKREKKTEELEVNSEQSSDHNEHKKEHKHKRHGSPSNYIYLKTRAKIQKLLTADFDNKNIRQKASDLLDEADRIPMTLEILKDTKIGKVVKKFSQIEIKNDTLDLTKRATDLLVKWKSVVVPHHKNPKINDTNTPNESSEQLDHSENENSTATKLSENEVEESANNKNNDESINLPKENDSKNSIETENKDENKMDEDKSSIKEEQKEQEKKE
ncbi:Tudor/PWWP/MBT [Piromyces finnis]|uniref:Tudor/PWWP/MBT n=1 Tax=Piromyces finnis TaxID=1754191 RepID=A0A1Y1VB21_9FUNG|nr:Tudor/PWWP/MBT [Piromyces finnis]|eukprot:ORX51496.1 Tudor/PWWP/MBT [Piromyces finnis]